MVDILFALILGFVWSRLGYNAYSYELKKDAIYTEQGVIWKHFTSLPYDRIQNVNIRRGVAARALGLSELEIESAGASGTYRAESRLPGLDKGYAEKIREQLFSKAKKSRRSIL